MPYAGHTAITVTKKVYERLKETYHDENSDEKVSLSFSKWTEKHLWDVIERYEVWKNYMPLLEEQSINEDGISIRDHKINRTAILTLRKSDLYCDVDETFNCVHIGFAWSLPKVYRIMKERGRKPPQNKKED